MDSKEINPTELESSSDAAAGSQESKSVRAWGRWVWVATGVLVLLLAAVSVYLKLQKPPELVKPTPKLADVEVITINSEDYEESLTLPARIMADADTSISFEFGGRLEKWLVGEGEQVKKGQKLAILDTEALQTELLQLQAEKQATAASVDAAKASIDLAAVAEDRAANERSTALLQLESAESARDLASREYTRSQSLAKQSIISTADLESAADRLTQAELAVSTARETIAMAQFGIQSAKIQARQSQANLELSKAQLARIEAGIKSLNIRLRKSECKAPFSGTLDDHLANVGEVVAGGQVIARLYDLAHVRAEVNVADRYVPFLERQEGAMKQFLEESLPGARQKVEAQLIIPGMPHLDGGRGPSVSLPAKIVRIAQAADTRSNTFVVELRLRNPGDALKQGMIVRAKINYLNYPNAIVIPMTAVQVTDNGPRCLIVEQQKEKSLARLRRIQPRAIDQDRVLVVGELKVGDRLIVAGGKGVIDGEEVRVLKMDGVFVDAAVDNGEKRSRDKK